MADPTSPRGLIIVDVQRDFCEGGSLAVDGGAAVAARIAHLLESSADSYDVIVATEDFHVEPGEHFAAEGTEPDYAATWPVHCVAGSEGARLHPALEPAAERHVDEIFRKGERSAAYSGFEGVSSEGIGLGEYLERAGVQDLDVVGIATDHCVRATVLDALEHLDGRGQVRVLTDLVAGVAPDSTEAAFAEMTAAGATLSTSALATVPG